VVERGGGEMFREMERRWRKGRVVLGDGAWLF